MSAAAKISSYKLHGLVTFLYLHRISPTAAASTRNTPGLCPATQGHCRDFFLPNYYSGCGHNYMNRVRGLRSFSDGRAKEAAENPHSDVVKDEDKKTQPTLPVSDKQGFSPWAKWLLGAFLSVLLPFLKHKWEGLRGLEGQVEKVVEEVEVVAEMVEKVATVAEKVSSEVAEKLPENTKIKQAALIVEHISTVTAQEAKLTEDFIHKVGEVTQDLKEMKTIAERVIDKIVEPHQQNVPSSDNK